MTKKKDPKDYLKIGRPTVMTKEILAKLEQGFKIGLNDEECCSYADIDAASLYRYQLKNPDFCKLKKQWKLNPIAKAKYTIYRNLDDNKTAQWYLEKKCSHEFCGNQINNVVNVNNTNQAIQINKEEIKEVIDGINQLTDGI